MFAVNPMQLATLRFERRKGGAVTISSSSENGTVFHEVNFFLEKTAVAEIELAGGKHAAEDQTEL